MINWELIKEFEGAAVTEGYVPMRDGEALESSGVTIASGFDIGQRSENDLWDLNLGAELTECLTPYANLRGEAAVEAINRNPLTVTDEDAEVIDEVVHARFERRVERKWNESSNIYWTELSDRQQTIVMSVTYQYGSPWRRCPTFWRLATDDDWDGVIAELRDFGDSYPTRRNREADYLEG